MTYEKLAKIYDLAKEGKTNREIADELYFEEGVISHYIRELKNDTSKFYNISLYEEIMSKRNTKKKFMSDEEVEEIINLIFLGKSKLEICALMKKSAKNITTLLGYFKRPVTSYYRVDHQKISEQLQENNNKTQEEYNEIIENIIKTDKEGLEYIKTLNTVKVYFRSEKIKKMVRTYIDSDYSLCDQRLATDFGLQKTTVGEILRGQNKYYDLSKYATPEEIKKIYEKRKENLIQIKKEQRKIASQLFSDKFNREEKDILNSINTDYLFWVQFLFTFRLSIEDFAKLLNFRDQKALYDKMLSISSDPINYNLSLENLFSVTKSNEKKLKRAEKYLKCLKAYEDDEEQKEKLLIMINDHEYYKLLSKRKSWNNLTSEEKNIVIQYRIKYLLPYPYIPYSRELILQACSDEQRKVMDLISRGNEELVRIRKFKNRKEKDV